MPPTSLLADRFCIADPQADLLGRGGMGAVYRGEDTTTGQAVAIKALHSEFVQTNSESVARFEREGEVLRQLNHPNIVRYIASVQQDSQHYLVMEYVEGGSLADLLARQRPLPINKALRIALELADALARAHHLGVIHRDLKPANVLLARDGTPRLTDFGVAHLTGSAVQTQSGMIIGTPDYLSPEACRGETVDGRADIWAFGVMLYEMLAGELPFRGDTLISKLTAIITSPVPDMLQLHPEIPEDLVDLIYRMLEKDRQQRMPSMRLVGAELESILQVCCAGDSSTDTPTAQAILGRGRFVTPPSMPGTRQKHNLPTQPTPFVGREPELAELDRLLDDPQVRVVSILGLGGMGKTRLALECAARRLEAYPHGVYFIGLAPLQTVEAILPALASALNFNFDRRLDPRQQILNYLSEKRMLLVFDNFEHLLAGVDLVDAIVQAAPGVQALATSRERLNAAGEYIFHLEGMDFPDWETPQNALEYGAVKLFMQSAHRVQPSFELKPADLRYVARICRLMQGMPLAILMAAAWMEMLSPQEVADELSTGVSETHALHGLDTLGSNLQDLPSRQRSVRVVFDYSWERIGSTEKQVLLGLGVFRGGFSRAAAQAVTGATLPSLMTLVNKSLLHRSPSGRYEMHELLRQYAEDQLAQSPGGGESVRERHADWYLDHSRRWLVGIQGFEQYQHWIDIELEYKNLRTAWDWMVCQCRSASPHTQHQAAVWLEQAAEGLGWFYWFTDRLADAITAFHSATEAVGALVDGDSQADANLRRALAMLLVWQAQFDSWRPGGEPLPLYQRSLALLEKLEQEGEDVRLPLALALAGYSNLVSNAERRSALQFLQRSITLLRQLGRRWELSMMLLQLSQVIHDLGDLKTAQGIAEESLAISQVLGDRLSIEACLERLGHILWVQGQLDASEKLLRQAAALADELGHRDFIAGSLTRLGEAMGRQGKFADGEALIQQAIAIRTDLNHVYGVAMNRIMLGEVHLHQGHYAEALSDCNGPIPWKWGTGFAHFISGLAWLGQAVHGQPTPDRASLDQSAALLQDAATTFEELEHRESLGWTRGGQAYLLRLQGQHEAARRCVNQAFQAARDTQSFFPFLYALPAAALLAADQGHLERSAELYTLAWNYGFVARSRWFSELAEHTLLDTLSTLPKETIASARQRGKMLTFPDVLDSLIEG